MGWEIDRQRALMERGTNLGEYPNIQISHRFLSLFASRLPLLKYPWPNGLIIGSQGAQKYSSPSLWVVQILVLVSYRVDMSTWGEGEGKRKSSWRARRWCLKGIFSPCFFSHQFSFCWLPLFHTHTCLHTFSQPSFPLSLQCFSLLPVSSYLSYWAVTCDDIIGYWGIMCVSVRSMVCSKTWLFTTHTHTPAHPPTGSRKVLFASESLFLPRGCWESPIVWIE